MSGAGDTAPGRIRRVPLLLTLGAAWSLLAGAAHTKPNPYRGLATVPILENLAAELQRAPSDAPLPVIVTLNRSLDGLKVETLPWSRQPGCLRREFPGARAVACRLTRDQMDALASTGAVAQLELDAVIRASRESSNETFGTTAARARIALDGDGDGDAATYSASDNTIAVIDTGIDAAHADFAGGKVIGWHDFVSERPEPYDDNGHGTHVASIAAGHRDGGTDGVAPGASLVGLKVLAANGAGRTSDIAAALQWCIDNRERLGIRVINMSLGSEGSSSGRDFGSRMVDRAVAAGIVVVAVAGNEGPDTPSIGSPGAAASAITVGSMADPGKGGFALSPFSSRGPTRDGRVKPDIIAPGEAILAANANTGDGYTRHSGTSMAAPFVAGVAALMLDANPALTPEELRDRLERTAIDFGAPGKDNEYGAGRLDAFTAIRAARGDAEAGDATPGELDPPAHAAAQESLEEGATREFPIEVTDTALPVAATLILDAEARAAGLDADLRLLDPDGQVVAESATDQRQERVRFRPRQTGTYTLQVVSRTGAGGFVLDISGAVLATAPELPGPMP
jgi:serine protease AprX